MFMDEIHRLSKSQQDVLLPALEQGIVKFIGATTENPSFEVNNAILSRSLVFRFEALTAEALVQVQKRALTAEGMLPRQDVTDEWLTAIAETADGDARRALNLLEAAVAAAPAEVTPITPEALRSLAQAINLQYD